jgi:hypothetical protein
VVSSSGKLASMREGQRHESEELKAFLAFFADRFLNAGSLPPQERPIAVLEGLESKKPGLARIGLRQAIIDCVEMSLRLKAEDVKKLDDELRARGIVTLSELRRRYSKRYAAIVKRGRIKTDSEWHLIRAALNDPSADVADEREVLEGLIADY